MNFIKRILLATIIIFSTACEVTKKDVDPPADFSQIYDLNRIILGKENSLLVIYDRKKISHDFSVPVEMTLEYEFITDGPVVSPVRIDNEEIYFTNLTNKFSIIDTELNGIVSTAEVEAPVSYGSTGESPHYYFCDASGRCYRVKNSWNTLEIEKSILISEMEGNLGTPTRWKYPNNNYSYFFVAGEDGTIRALDFRTEAEFPVVWDYQTDGAITGNPLAHNVGTASFNVAVGSDDGFLYSLNAFNGQLNWQFNAGSPIQSSPEINYYYDKLGQTTLSTPRVFFGAQDGKVYSVNAITGDLLWEYQTGGAVSSPQFWPNENVLASEIGWVYVCSSDGNVYCFDSESGALEWSKDLDDGPILSSPTCIESRLEIDGISSFTVYVSTYNGVYGLNGVTGEILSQIQVEGVALSSPVVTNYDYSFNSWERTSYPSDVSAGPSY